jgi:hypothetical protein
VARDEEFRHGQARDAAAKLVGGDDAAAEEALVDPHAHGGIAFDAGGGEVLRVDVRNFLNRFAQSLRQQAFAFVSQRFGMVGELLPDVFLALGSVRRALDSPCLKCGVETGEV